MIAQTLQEIINDLFLEIMRHVENMKGHAKLLADTLRDLKRFRTAADILLKTVCRVLPDRIFKRNTDGIPAPFLKKDKRHGGIDSPGHPDHDLFGLIYFHGKILTACQRNDRNPKGGD
jgi:hypothetical protein